MANCIFSIEYYEQTKKYCNIGSVSHLVWLVYLRFELTHLSSFNKRSDTLEIIISARFYKIWHLQYGRSGGGALVSCLSQIQSATFLSVIKPVSNILCLSQTCLYCQPQSLRVSDTGNEDKASPAMKIYIWDVIHCRGRWSICYWSWLYWDMFHAWCRDKWLADLYLGHSRDTYHWFRQVDTGSHWPVGNNPGYNWRLFDESRYDKNVEEVRGESC